MERNYSRELLLDSVLIFPSKFSRLLTGTHTETKIILPVFSRHTVALSDAHLPQQRLTPALQSLQGEGGLRRRNQREQMSEKGVLSIQTQLTFTTLQYPRSSFLKVMGGIWLTFATPEGDVTFLTLKQIPIASLAPWQLKKTACRQKKVEETIQSYQHTG